MKAISYIILILFIIPVYGQSYVVNSPDNTINIEVSIDQSASFKVSLDAKPLLTTTRIGIQIDKMTSPVWKVKKASHTSVNQVLHPVVHEKTSSIQDNFNELKLQFQNKLALTFRAYNHGIAYRWESAIKDSIKVLSELAQFGFTSFDKAWYPSEKSFYSHNERLYKQYSIIQIADDSLASLPALVNHDGINVLISEADLFDYPGMWLTGNSNDKLIASFPHYPAREKLQGDRNVMVDKTEEYLAKTVGIRTYPWRVFMIGRKDADLLSNQLVYQLSRQTSEDFSWVQPGKIAWDWWNALNVYGVDFKSGINTATYKYFIDFAAKYRLEYIILDEGWSPTTDVTRSVEALDMPELLAYAKERKVGIILWVLWNSLDKQMVKAMDLYAQWGIKGIKVDFMQRDDQKMVNFYERTAQEAAKRKLLVDFHGAFKPTGLERLYPNVITREGVYGLEQSKWDAAKSISPEHNVTLPFIRNAVGPMDYTPGAMINAQADSWAPIFQRPMSLGTRCHQLAMYVVFTSPLQMLSDSPSNYYREPECMEFLLHVPSIWDKTVTIDGKTGDYVVIARKAANGDWYVGAMSDWTARDIPIDFSFLENENYVMDIWQDGINADRVGIDFARNTTNVTNTTKQNIHLAPGGGWVARIKKSL
jgi:alpha-glucosidase